MKKLGNIFRPSVVVGLLVIVLIIGIHIYLWAQSLESLGISDPFNRDEEIMRLYKEVTRQKEQSMGAFVEFTRLQIELLNIMDPQ